MILVTGAAGLSGSIIVRELGKQQIQAKALVRSRSKARWIAELPSLQLVEGDMGEAGTLHDALRGVDRVLMISSSDERLVETQCTFIDACKRAGVKHVVKLSGKESACLSWRNRPRTHLIACERILAPVENVIEENVATK